MKLFCLPSVGINCNHIPKMLGASEKWIMERRRGRGKRKRGCWKAAVALVSCVRLWECHCPS